MLNINKNKFLIIILFLIFLLFQSCTDKGVDVQVINNPRNYTWTLDTLQFSNSNSESLGDIWGINSKDIYMTGGGSQLWKYDGKIWNDITSTLPLQNIKNPFLIFINGLSQNDIWISGSSSTSNNFSQSLILHYNGSNWVIDNSIMGLGISSFSISGANIWATDFINVYKYNGANFVKRELPSKLIQQLKNHQTLNILSLAATDTNLFAVMIIVNHPNSPFKDKYYFVKYKNNTWTVIDSLLENNLDKWGQNLWRGASGKLYSFNNAIFKWNGKNWEKLFQTNSRIVKIFGTNDNNIFALGAGSSVYHFNGVNWKKLDQLVLPNVGYSGVWTDGKETFIVGSTLILPIRPILWHGK